MSELRLKPFAQQRGIESISVVARVQLNSSKLWLNYQLSGGGSDLVLPEPAAVKERQNELWKSTCFEAFLLNREDGAYYEFNLSPCGHWNVYRFDEYRQGMRPDERLRLEGFSVQPNSKSLDYQATFSGPFADLGSQFCLGLSAVIESRQSGLSYWALYHAGEQPDFHLSESFIVSLALTKGR